MDRYSIEFKGVGNAMVIGYTTGKLVEILFPEWMEIHQIAWMMKYIPICEPDLSSLDEYKHKFKVMKLEEDISFENFWNEYDYKIGKKQRAEKLFKELSNADKSKCIQKIKAYKFFLLQKNIDKLYPETWISQRRFENEFKV
jgi:hypothetical protein